MIRALILKRIDSEEQVFGASLDYMRHIVRTSLGSFFKFLLFTPLANHRKQLPAAAFHVARLVATEHEDCGTCVQIVVNLARKDGISAEILKAALEHRPDDLPAELSEIYRFTRAVVSAGGDEESLRERIRERYGEAALVELALAIAACRVFPITKRALGYATSCALVKVEL